MAGNDAGHPAPSRLANRNFSDRITSPAWGRCLEQIGQEANPWAARAAQGLSRTLQTGCVAELRQLSRDDLEQFAQALSGRFSREELAALLEEQFKIPRAYSLAAADPQSTLLGLVQAALGGPENASLGATRLIFTDRCEGDGTVSGARGDIPTGAKRVYAVFENDGALQGLDTVFAIWRIPAEDQIGFAGCEAIRAGTRYNYVWLQVGDGWPAGDYRLDLCDPRNPALVLASQGFHVD